MAITLNADRTLVENISNFFPNEQGITVSVLRLDLVHPVVSGNKWFKLKYNLAAALDAGQDQLLTFGGAYSNHLIATAAAAANAGLRAIGVVRGLHAQDALTPTLLACKDYGMKLHFVSRADYERKNEPELLLELQARFGKSFVIPEGGDNEAGRKGVGEIAALIPDEVATVCVAVGTGTTFAGIRNALPAHVQLLGFPAMKGGDYLKEPIATYLHDPASANWKLNADFAFNGFAKTTPELIDFIQSFYAGTGIPLDIVYTGKMMFGIRQFLQQQAFAAGEHILCIHTGGLQGNPAGLFTPLR